MNYERYGVMFPKSGLCWQDAGDDDDPGTDPAAGGDPDAQKEETVPVSVVQAVRNELNELKDQILIYKSALREKGNQQAGDRPQPTQQVNVPTGDDPLAGKEDDDILTAGEIKKFFNAKEMSLAMNLDLRDLAKSPDFELVLKTHWPKVLAADPDLGKAMRGMNTYAQAAFAYKMGLTDPDYKATKTTPPAKEPEPKTKPDARPRSPAAAGAAVNPPVEDAGFWAGMSDKEFDEAREKKMRRARA